MERLSKASILKASKIFLAIRPSRSSAKQLMPSRGWAILLLAFLIFAVSSQPLYSQGILPSGSAPVEGIKDCDELLTNKDKKVILENEKAFRDAIPKKFIFAKQDWLKLVLGCALRTGKIKLFMIPFFITYIVQFLLSIAGLIAVLFVVYGGFRYATGGLGEDKESGKKIIQHALLGLVVALSAWIVVNFIQIALTS